VVELDDAHILVDDEHEARVCIQDGPKKLIFRRYSGGHSALFLLANGSKGFLDNPPKSLIGFYSTNSSGSGKSQKIKYSLTFHPPNLMINIINMNSCGKDTRKVRIPAISAKPPRGEKN